MDYLALQMLFEDRGKYFAMLAGICFAALIMTQQPAIFVGLMERTYVFISNSAVADIWVMDPSVQFVEEHKPIRDMDLTWVRGIAGVEWAVPMSEGIVMMKLPDGNLRSFALTGLDDASLIGAPEIVEGTLMNLRHPDAVIVDRAAANTRFRVQRSDGTTRPLALGDEVEINDHRAVVAGYAKTQRNFVLQPFVYTTYSRAVEYGLPDSKHLSYLLVKAKPGVDVKKLARRIADTTGLAAYTNEEFKKYNYDYWMDNTGIPLNFLVSVGLGFLVGAAIAGQAFFNFVRDNIQQYAALKAIGATNAMLTRMVLLQAAVVTFAGYGIGVGLSALFGLEVNDSMLAFHMSPWLLPFAGGGVLLIIMTAAMFAIRQVKTVDPVMVFRT
jgi:putative ABC transport system permease protein